MVKKKDITVEELSKLPEADLVVNHIIDRKKSGLYTLVMVSGLPGTGKTSTCFRLGELIHLNYNGVNNMKADNIIDSFLALTEFVINAKPEELNVAVVEEVSVLFPSRRAMSGGNVDLAKLLDTCRKKQVILLANAPIWPSIDSHMKALGNVYIQTKKIYKMAQIVYSKMYWLQTDPRSGKTYTHCFKRDGRDVKKMFTKMPCLEEWKKYEARKDIFMDDLYKRLKFREEKRLSKEMNESGMKREEVRPLSQKELQIYDMIHRKKMNLSAAARVLGVSSSYISQTNKKINDKLQIVSKNEAIYSKNPRFKLMMPLLQPIR